MNKKILSGVLSGVLVTGIIPTTVEATTNFDILYKQAYDSTIKAIEGKKQIDINLARDAVRALSKNLSWAKGEFSKQLDAVQHPILKAIVDAINFASSENELTQANINIVFNLISVDLPKQFRESYSSARDELQQKFLDKVIDAVKVAEESLTLESKLNAQDLVDELKTAVSEKVVDVANNVLQVRLNAIILENENSSSGEVTLEQAELLQAIINSNGDSESLFLALKNAGFDVLEENKQDYKSDFSSILSLIEDGEYIGMEFIHSEYVFDNIEKLINVINSKTSISKNDSIEDMVEKIDFAVQNILDIKDREGNVFNLLNSNHVNYDDIIEYQNSDYTVKSEVAQVIKYKEYSEFDENGNLKCIEFLFRELVVGIDNRKAILGITQYEDGSLNSKAKEVWGDIILSKLKIINDGVELPLEVYTKFLKARSYKYEIKSGADAGKGTFKTFEEIREVLNEALLDDSQLNVYELMLTYRDYEDKLVEILNYGGFEVNENHNYTMPKMGEKVYFVLDIYNIAKDALYNDSCYGRQNIQNWIDAVDLSYSFKEEKSEENLVEMLDSITQSILDIEIPEEYQYNLDTFTMYNKLSDSQKKDFAYLSKMIIEKVDSTHIYWRAINSVHISLLKASAILENM